LKAKVSRLQRSVTCLLLNKWRSDQWSDTLETLDFEDQPLWKMTKRLMRFLTLSPPLQVSGGQDPSDSERAAAQADSLEA
jgi:hypothetical protein